MNAVVQQSLRTAGEAPDQEALLAPQACRVLPSGNRMPLLGLGTWQLTSHTVDTVREAIGLGFRMLDTAVDYHTQRGIGEAIRESGVERDALYVIAKVEPGEDAYAATRRNLAQLRLNYLDLVLIHRPPERGAGEQEWQGLRQAKREGLVHDIGVSSYSIDRIEDLVYRTGEMPAVNQVEWSPFGHSPRMLDFCRDNDIIIQASSPLTRATRLNDDKVGAMAARYGKTPAQLLIRWNLQLGVVPLPKANQVRHQRDNLNVFDFEISTQDMVRLNGLNAHYSSLEKLRYI
jgi:diketogulonate reductase-like aldo/keto reductase